MSKIKKDSIGDRMKNYESVYKQKTIQRVPLIIHVDDKAFHTFTKKFQETIRSVTHH